MAERSHSACVIVRTPQDDTVVVFKPFEYSYENPNDLLKNFPGGSGEVGETPQKTAARELYEETGIDIRTNRHKLELLCAVPKKGGHHQFFFVLWLERRKLQNLKKYGSGDEVVRIFKLNNLKPEEMPPSHGIALNALREKEKASNN